jgi:hypothetical protein
MQPGSRTSWRAVVEEFDRAWKALAGTGVCDAIGGAEYRRLSNAWTKAGKPDPAAFIRRQSIGERQRTVGEDVVPTPAVITLRVGKGDFAEADHQTF